ncbi:MAG: enoyl-CoA hydratase/isomerase family protein [Nocardioidaceae bacterium]|nr:enoyl-CoA hydratase/isomerase family protein [Nocardioidaceae bacterium]
MAEVVTECVDGVLRVTLDRPEKLNALTWTMYDALEAACEQAHAPEIRAMVLRSSSNRAFAAGTDITQFRAFRSGADAVAYERRVSAVLDAILAVPVPTLASITGCCIGGGFLVACACDLRLASTDAVFGAPMARTLGNCLSQQSSRLLVDLLGRGPTMDLLLRARLMSAEEAHQRGFLAVVCAPEELDSLTDAELDNLRDLAPLSLWAAKAALNRTSSPPTEDEDILRTVYGSHDFRQAVEGFGSGRLPSWTGT